MIFLKPKITKLIQTNNFFPCPCNTDGYYSGTDSKEGFEKRLKTMPADWYYRTNTVRYTVNKQQYRTQEFSTIDWANSVVLLGCSQTYGIGVSDEHTISSHLSKMIGKNVVNLGVPGASNSLIANNSIMLHSGYSTPLAVVHIWSGVDRTTYYHNREITNHGPWTLNKKDPFMTAWSEDYANSEVHTLMASKIVNQLWKEKTKLIEVTNFTDTHKLLNCYYLTMKNKDYARDDMHFGLNTTKHIATQIKDQL